MSSHHSDRSGNQGSDGERNMAHLQGGRHPVNSQQYPKPRGPIAFQLHGKIGKKENPKSASAIYQTRQIFLFM